MQTNSARKSGNFFYRDRDLSPALGSSMWEDCPILPALQDPAFGFQVRDHFTKYAAGDWTETKQGAGTIALTDALGGRLLVTNAAADNDSVDAQLVGETFQLVAGKPLWVEFGFQVSDATQSDVLVGLCITDTTLIDGLSDGIYFLKDDDDANIDYHCEKDSVDTTGDTGLDLADATDIRLGMKFLTDGATVEYWGNGNRLASARANIPDDELLRLSYALQNGEAVAKTMQLDYIFAFQVLANYF